MPVSALKFLKVHLCLMLMTSAATPPAKSAEVLTLSEAVSLAVSADPDLAALRAERLALLDESIAVGQLPDPLLKFGSVAVPVDTFHLDQEPMTQLQIGLIQQFPKGDTRRLRERRTRELASMKGSQELAMERMIERAVRRGLVRLHGERHAYQAWQAARVAVAELEQLALDDYGVGMSRQQDVDAIGVELARLDQRLLEIDQTADALRTELAVYLGESAWLTLDEGWPELPDVPDKAEILSQLASHPMVAMALAQERAAAVDVDLAQEQYKPGFKVDLTFGDRFGNGVDGRSRSDLLSAMVTMDLPIFSDRRQDRQLSASRHRQAAAELRRDDILRDLRAQTIGHYRALDRIDRRMELYETRVLPQASNGVSSALQDYQSATGDLAEVLRAQLTVDELTVDQLRARTDRLLILTDILYLADET